MKKPTTKTFAIQLKHKQAAIVSVTASGSIEEFADQRIAICDSHGYLIAMIHLAMDATRRQIEPLTA